MKTSMTGSTGPSDPNGDNKGNHIRKSITLAAPTLLRSSNSRTKLRADIPCAGGAPRPADAPKLCAYASIVV
jgi:hypothetical protein